MTASHSHGRIPEEAHGHTEPTPHHAVPYYKIFILLTVLTVVTVGIYFLLVKLGVRNELVRVIVALSIAAVKAGFVALFFMHLKFEGKLIYLIAIVPLVLTVLLVTALIPDVIHGPLFNPLPPLQSAEHGTEAGHAAPAEHAPQH
jgi:cytochrome c oxidase subunit 4